MKLPLPLALLLLASAVPAPACINDSATSADEQRFVSGYDREAPARPSPLGVEQSEFHAGVLLLLAPGALLIGLGVLWLRQERLLAAKRQQRALARVRA
jgi:hypothetical protein